jgi:hypothetical protein
MADSDLAGSNGLRILTLLRSDRPNPHSTIYPSHLQDCALHHVLSGMQMSERQLSAAAAEEAALTKHAEEKVRSST